MRMLRPMDYLRGIASASLFFVAMVFYADATAETVVLGTPIRLLSLDILNGEMSRAVDLNSPYADDLPARPKVGGFCPTFTDKLWALPASIVDQCVTPAVTEALKSCRAIVAKGTSAGALANAASCLQSLAAQADFSKPLDRALNAVSGSVACMMKGVVAASQDSPQEKRAAMAVIDGAEATYKEYTALSKIAINLAKSGPGAIPDFLAIDISGNDGDGGSIGVGDWAIELSTIADDPAAYARARTADKFKTKLTEALARAIFDPVRSKEEFLDALWPDRLLARTDDMLAHCELADAQLVWAQRRLALELKIQDHRISMETYRHQTMCQLTEGAQDFNRPSVPEREWETALFGMHIPNVSSVPRPFKDWKVFYSRLNRALGAYEKFRKEEAAFQEKFDAELRDLKPLLDEARELASLARSNIRTCTGLMTPGTGLTGFDDPVKELEARLLDLKARMYGHGCSKQMANKFLGDVRYEIGNPFQKWTDFMARANRDLSTGRACSGPGIRSLMADLERSATDSFGSMAALQTCMNTDRQRRIVGDILALSISLEQLDGLIADAGAQVEACDKDAARQAIGDARTMLASMPCRNRAGPASRAGILKGLEALLALPDCAVAEAPGGYVVRISGSGYIPHYAGGSFFTSGHHDILIELGSDANQADLLARLNEIRDGYDGDPCKVEIPAIPGLVKTPVVWRSGPKVEVVVGPVARLRNVPDLELEKSWRVVDDYDKATGKWTGPSITELRKAACKAALRQ